MGRKLLVLVLVFAAFYMGAHYYIRWRNTVTDDVSKISRLVECDPNEMKGLKITAADGSEYSFTRADQPRAGLSPAAQLSFSEWQYDNPIKGEADASLMIRLATMFCEIYDPIPTDDAQFKAGATTAEKIFLRLEGGKAPGEHSLQFGPISGDRLNVVKYQGPGVERVVKIQPKILTLASLKPKDYLNTKVMRMSADNVMVATIFENQKEKFTLERQDDGWRVLRGGKLLGPGNEEAGKYINRLTTLKALRVNEEGLSPTACEAGSARMHVQLAGVGDRAETLYFQYQKKGDVAACNSAREALFVVHRDIIPYLETPSEKLLGNP
jgi:hypothetical protein